MSKYFIVLICMSFLATGCGTNSTTLATVRGEKITLKEFEDQFRNLPPAYQVMLTTPAMKEKLLDQMITEKLMIQEAIKEGLPRKKEVQERLTLLKNQMLIEELIKVKVFDKINISDDEAKEFYETHQTQLSQAFPGKGFDEIKQDIKRMMMRKDETKTRLMFQTWIEGLKKEAKITKNLTLLGSSKKEEGKK
ncbi:MAG: SurA N-terminal domain-containing protein [bacterium]